MEVMGIAIAFLGVILTYIWRSNGKLQRSMMEALLSMGEGQREIAAGQREIAAGQREIAQMLFNQTKILEKIESRVG